MYGLHLIFFIICTWDSVLQCSEILKRRDETGKDQGLLFLLLRPATDVQGSWYENNQSIQFFPFYHAGISAANVDTQLYMYKFSNSHTLASW